MTPGLLLISSLLLLVGVLDASWRGLAVVATRPGVWQHAQASRYDAVAYGVLRITTFSQLETLNRFSIGTGNDLPCFVLRMRPKRC
jgi:hypothetical protein